MTHQALLDPQDRKARLARKAQPDLQETLDQLAPQVMPARSVQQALTAMLVLPEKQARKVQLALTAPLLVRKVRPETSAPLDLLALLVQTAPLRDPQALKDRLAQLELTAP